MSNVDKYVAEISNAAWRTDKTARWAEILQRALAEQREGIANEIINRTTSVDDAPVTGMCARVARTYGKEQS